MYRIARAISVDPSGTVPVHHNAKGNRHRARKPVGVSYLFIVHYSRFCNLVQLDVVWEQSIAKDLRSRSGVDRPENRQKPSNQLECVIDDLRKHNDNKNEVYSS